MHYTEDVKGRCDVKDLEDQVPWELFRKDVEVAGAEHERVKDLGDERDTLGASVAVDGEDEDAFREGVGQVAQDSEELRQGSVCNRENGKHMLQRLATYVPRAHCEWRVAQSSNLKLMVMLRGAREQRIGVAKTWPCWTRRTCQRQVYRTRISDLAK